MSRIGDSGYDIPAVQGSDVGDNEIINGTKMTQLGPDAFKLSFALPSGRVLESAPFNSDFRRKAMLAWVDAVRQNIVADAHEAAAVARRAAIPPVDDAPATPPGPVGADRVARHPEVVGAFCSDPTALITAQFEAASQDLDRALFEYATALEKKTAAEAAVSQWKKLLDVVRLPHAPPLPAAPMSDTSLLAALGSVGRSRRKRARTPPPTSSAPSPPPAPPVEEATDR